MTLQKLLNNLIDKKYYEYSILKEKEQVFVYLKLNCYIMPFKIFKKGIKFSWLNNHPYYRPTPKIIDKEEFSNNLEVYFRDSDLVYFYSFNKKYFDELKENIIYFFENILCNAKKDDSGFVYE